MVAYCSTTRRLAVGSRVGHIALYELRSSRCQLIPAHENAITALAFSPEGKVLASYSVKDKRISFYQVLYLTQLHFFRKSYQILLEV